MKASLIAAFGAVALAGLACAAQAAPSPATSTAGDCRIGAYRLADGALVVVDPSSGDALRWRRLDGTTGMLHPQANGGWTSTRGWTDAADGHVVSFSACAEGEMSFDGKAGHRVALDVTDTTFKSGDVVLAGRLVLPKGDGPVPIVVLVHGSEDSSARDFYTLQRMLPAEGVGVFVYDKRGTGQSTGHYTQDFGVLATDAATAFGEARRMAGPRAGRVGYQGGSQGGWIAPLAALRSHPDFVIVGFGLAVTELQEDEEEVALEMQLAGHTPAEIAQAQEVAYAAQTLVASDFNEGADRFIAVRAKYRNASWFKDLHGNLSRFFLPMSDADLKAGKKPFEIGLSWSYDGMETLRRLDVPQLWELGADDLEAPSAETSRRLRSLMAQGHPITLAIFPKTEHGIYEFETKPDGERLDTRNADGYFAMLRDFARDGRVSGRYGAAVVEKPSSGSR
jgi:pimeloyl-ACP methyl ester carboxylesterase